MVHKILKFQYHVIMLSLTIVLCCVAYIWSDRSEPTTMISIRLTPYDIVPGDPFTVIETFVVHKPCPQHIEQHFTQGEAIALITSPPPSGSGWFMVRTGWMTQSFDNLAPLELKPGPSKYVMQLAWVCWWNPITWVSPFNKTMTYDVKVIDGTEIIQ